MVQERAEGPKAPSPGRCPGLGASALSGRVGQTWGSSFFIPPSAYFAQSNDPVGGFRYPSFQVRR